MTRSTAAFVALMTTALAACGDEAATEEATPERSLSVSCPEGKCDGLADRIRDLYDDMRAVDLNDLTGLGVGLATDAFNDALAVVPFVDIELAPTEFFGEPRTLFGQTIAHDLDGLHAGLTERLGERAFVTHVTALRTRTLAERGGVFAESSFSVGADLSHDWSMDVGDAVGTVGFAGDPTLEVTVIAPHADNFEAVWRNPLKTLAAARDFVLPRHLGDLRKMAPGESVSLRGEGQLGFNLGVGVPIVLGTVADSVTLNARISAAARVNLSGQLDVQLVRGGGDTAWIDVGLGRHRVKHFALAVDTAWGVAGLPEVELDLGPAHIDLARLAERALEKQLNEKLSVFSATASEGRQESRLNVARFEVDLSRDGTAVRQAINQAMRGDIRLAQALANRPGSGVEQVLDLAKDSRSEASYLGFRFLSMRFFVARDLETGTVHVDEGDRQQTLLFSELEKRSGLFFTERGSTWRQVTSLVTEGGRLVDAQVNARLTLRENDRFLTKDQILDHVDPLLAWLLGPEAVLVDLGEATDGLFRYADHTCRTPDRFDDDDRDDDAYDACVEGLSETDEFMAFEEKARRRYGDLAASTDLSGFDADFATLPEVARRLFDLKVGLSGIHDQPNAHLDGPKGALIAQVRFAQPALDALMAVDAPERFAATAEDVLELMHADRDEDVDEKVDEMADFGTSKRGRIAPMAKVLRLTGAEFRQLDEVAALKLDGETMGDHAHLLLVDLDDPDAVRLATVAEHKGALVAGLFEGLEKAARSLREPDTFVIGYALLALTDPADVELLVDYRFEADHEGGYGQWNTQLYGRGDADFIDAGLFDLDALLGAR